MAKKGNRGPYVSWHRTSGDGDWQLVAGRKHPRVVATVWNNGTWHTWDRNGVGGENSCESGVVKAMTEAAASAISQGFI